MYFLFSKFKSISVFLFILFQHSISLGANFEACYKLDAGNLDRRPPQIALTHICLNDDGHVQLFAKNSLIHEFNVQSKFFPSIYKCSTNPRTGKRSCRYTAPYIILTGQSDRASILAKVETSPTTGFDGVEVIDFDDDRFVFDDNKPVK